MRSKPLLAGIAGLVVLGGTAAGVMIVASPGGEEEAVQHVETATPSASAAATHTSSPSAATPNQRKASLPGGYEFSYPSSWTQVVVSEDPYIAKFFLKPPADPGSEALADLDVFVYENPQGLPLEEFFNGQERPNLFKDAVGGYKPFSSGEATGYWFDRVLGFATYTVVALSSDGFVYQFTDPQKHQADGVFLQIVQSLKPSKD